MLQHPWAGMGPGLNCTCMLIHGACKKREIRSKEQSRLAKQKNQTAI